MESVLLFIPVHDDNPLKSIPFQYVTLVLIAVNVALFLVKIGGMDHHAIASFAVVPNELIAVKYIGGPALDGYRTFALQQYDILNGNLTESELLTGENVRSYLENLNNIEQPAPPRIDFSAYSRILASRLATMRSSSSSISRCRSCSSRSAFRHAARYCSAINPAKTGPSIRPLSSPSETTPGSDTATGSTPAGSRSRKTGGIRICPSFGMWYAPWIRSLTWISTFLDAHQHRT